MKWRTRSRTFPGVAGVVADGADGQGGDLPSVAVVELGDGDVEALSDAGGEGAQQAALGLEGVALGQVEGDSCGCDVHGPVLFWAHPHPVFLRGGVPPMVVGGRA